MTLSRELKVRYWQLLLKSCMQFLGSAGLGNRHYQHLGFVVGPNATKSCADKVALYAATMAPTTAPEDLFDAVINTHCVRATSKPDPVGVYFEICSAYPRVPFEKSEPDRKALIEQLDLLEAARTGI